MQLCDSKGCRDICASEYNMCTALNEFMDNLLNSDSQPPTAPKKGGSSTFLADRAAAMQAMDEKLQEASTQILDSGADIHYLTLADARKHLANQRSTTMRVLGVSGTSDVADFEGDLAMLVEVNGVKVRLPLGVGYASSKVPKSLISAWRLLREVGGSGESRGGFDFAVVTDDDLGGSSIFDEFWPSMNFSSCFNLPNISSNDKLSPNKTSSSLNESSSSWAEIMSLHSWGSLKLILLTALS